MRTLLMSFLVLAVVSLTARAEDDEKTKERREKFQKTAKEFTKFREGWSARIKEAETRKEKEAIYKADLPRQEKYIAKVLALVEVEPKSDLALEMLQFVIQDMDGENEKAYDLLAANHAKSPKMKKLCLTYSDGGPKEARKFFATVLAENSDKTTQAYACLALGQTLVGLGQEGDKKALAEGEKYLERIVKDFAEVKLEDSTLSDIVKPLLFELRNLAVGMKVPATESRELVDGKKVKLSDYEGKVIVLDIWATWCGPCRSMIPDTRKLVEKMKDKPFVMISLSVDDEKETLETFLKKQKMPWVHWWHGKSQGIAKDWNIRAFPTIYVIDAKGVIRHKYVGVPNPDEIDEAVEALVKAAKP